MILQSAWLSIKPEAASEFESRFRKAQSILTGSRGYISHELNKCVEQDGMYLLLVKWQSISDHRVGFAGSPQHEAWLAELEEFYAEGPQERHYVRIRLD